MRHKSEEIKEFILSAIKTHPVGINPLVVERFGINRRTVVGYLQTLIKEGLLTSAGRTKARSYELRTLFEKTWQIPIDPQSEEHKIWRETLAPNVQDLKENVRDICSHGFQEMLNNVIDHSRANEAGIKLTRDAASIKIQVSDGGVGIFEKIRGALNLSDPREALLELSKGKFTTAPDRHSGEGIFFTSRMFDSFSIVSGELGYIAKKSDKGDWLFEIHEGGKTAGTVVSMEISAFSNRKKQDVFDRYSGVEAGFFRTHVPVALARYGQEKLVSRSQARRVLSRFEKFGEVSLDFSGVESIGQPFADEIFRVYANEHPKTKITHSGGNAQVEKMIAWVRGARGMQGPLL